METLGRPKKTTGPGPKHAGTALERLSWSSGIAFKQKSVKHTQDDKPGCPRLVMDQQYQLPPLMTAWEKGVESHQLCKVPFPPQESHQLRRTHGGLCEHTALGDCWRHLAVMGKMPQQHKAWIPVIALSQEISVFLLTLHFLNNGRTKLLRCSSQDCCWAALGKCTRRTNLQPEDRLLQSLEQEVHAQHQSSQHMLRWRMKGTHTITLFLVENKGNLLRIMFLKLSETTIRKQK